MGGREGGRKGGRESMARDRWEGERVWHNRWEGGRVRYMIGGREGGHGTVGCELGGQEVY